MVKRILSVLLVAMMLLSLGSCAGCKGPVSDPTSSNTDASQGDPGSVDTPNASDPSSDDALGDESDDPDYDDPDYTDPDYDDTNMGGSDISDKVENQFADLTPIKKGNVAKYQAYQLSYPGLNGFSGDADGRFLTDGVINKTDVGGDGWLLATIESDYYEMSSGDTFVELPTYSISREPAYTIAVDLGYVGELKSVSAVFGMNTGERIVLPKSVEVYLSNDGYNYTLYPDQTVKTARDGDVQTYTITFAQVQQAKAVKLVVFTNTGATNALAELSVNGTMYYQKKLLSKGVSYTTKAMLSDEYPDNGSKLTDDKKGTLDDLSAYVGMQVDEKDERTGDYCAVVTLDLKKVRNISEVVLEALYKKDLCWEPQFIAAYYSKDGKTYTDFGTAAVTSVYGKSASLCKSLFTITRNHTVAARYVRVKIYGMSDLMIDELRVYGCDEEVKEPIYDHVTKKNELVHTNVAELKLVQVDRKTTADLTDLAYTNDRKVVKKDGGKTVVEVPLDKTWEQVNGVALYFRTTGNYRLPTTIKTSVSTGGAYTAIKAEMLTSETAGSVVARQQFGDTKAKIVRFEIDSDEPYMLAEVAVYNGQSQLPVIDGGFINPNFANSAGSEAIAHLDDYMWYIMLKGMKDLGMDRVVVPYTTNKRVMKTLIHNDAALKKAGYETLRIHSSADVIEAIMDAADKLNMKVFMGTCLGVGYPDVPNDTYHDEVIAEAKMTMKALQEQYGDHKSFYAFYFSDETCDAWLNQPGAIEDFRKLYKSQSDYARQLDPEKLTMICPAIWRSGSADSGMDNIYNLIKSDTEGGRPIVDIVAQQDCLGRTKDLVLPDALWQSFEQYIEAWARGVRAAGAEFWNDLEAFNGYYVAKNIDDLHSALEMESKYTGGNIIFDIVNYFSPLCQTGRIDNVYRGVYSWEYTQQDYSLLQYVKYYQTRYAAANQQGLTATAQDAPSVTLPLPTGSTANLVPPVVQPPVSGGSPLSGTGVLPAPVVPSMGYPIAANQWGAFQTFKNSQVEYAMVYDSQYLYIAIKTNDTTPVTGKLSNWSAAKADMVQIFLTDGTKVNDVNGLKAADHGLRLSFLRTDADTFTAQVHAMGVESLGKGIFCESVTVGGKSEMIIAISWGYGLGIDAPKAGDQIGAKIVYYDMAEGATKAVSTSNNGDVGPSVGSSCIYTLK